LGGSRRLRFGDFEFDTLSGKLFHEARPVRIQPQPLLVLGALLERAGEIVSREQLRRHVWGDATFVDFDQGLNYCIRRIRLALRDRALKPVYIETLPRQGYRFIAPVEFAADPVPDSAAPPPKGELNLSLALLSRCLSASRAALGVLALVATIAVGLVSSHDAHPAASGPNRRNVTEPHSERSHRLNQEP